MAAQSVPPVEKLPLAARKNIRDEWESKVAENEKVVSELLKEPYKLEVNFNQFYAHAVNSGSDWPKTSPGACAQGYVEGFIDNLKRFTNEGQNDEAIQSFNELVTERKVTLEADSSFTYGGCTFKDGIFQINFNPGCPGTNTSYACSEINKSFDKALAAKDADALPLAARRSIQEDLESKRADLLASFKEELLGAEVKLEADYNEIWKTIIAATKVTKDIDLDYASSAFGRILYNYYDGVLSQMKYQFKKDDMVVEGYTESVPTGEIVVEVAPHGTTIKGGYNEAEIKDGKLIIRTNPKNFGTNTHYAGEKLMELL